MRVITVKDYQQLCHTVQRLISVGCYIRTDRAEFNTVYCQGFKELVKVEIK